MTPLPALLSLLTLLPLRSALAAPAPAPDAPSDTAAPDTAAPDTATTGDAAPCGGLYVLGTAPAYAQEGVPPAAPLLVQLSDNGCASAEEDVTVALRPYGGGAPLLSRTFSLSEIRAAHGVLRVQPAAPLDPGAAYELVATPAYGVESVVPFSTGSGDLQPIQADPAWDRLDLYWSECAAAATTAWGLAPAADPQGLSVVGVRVAGGAQDGEIVGMALAEYAEGAWSQDALSPPPDACLQGFQIDATGQERSAGTRCAEAEETDCPAGDTLEDGPIACGGCASGPAPWLPLALLWPALILRRRQP